MNHFNLINGVLHAEDVALSDIADAVGTPVYVYSRATFERHAQVFRDALSGLDNPHIAFAVKLSALIVKAVCHFMAYNRADTAVVKCIVCGKVKEGRL